jgi:uncharacterized protein YbgA (DUF1722 family)
MNKLHTIADMSATFGVSERTVQRWVENLVIKQNNKLLIPQDIYDLLKLRHAPDNVTTLGDMVATEPETEDEYPFVEGFTEDEYREYQKRLSEYPFLKERAEFLLKDMEYYRKSMSSKERQMELLLLAITNKRFIEE